MTELMALIQAHLDRYGVTRAEFARRAGTNPQTVHNWAGRLKALPEARHLHGVAEVIGQPYLATVHLAKRLTRFIWQSLTVLTCANGGAKGTRTCRN